MSYVKQSAPTGVEQKDQRQPSSVRPSKRSSVPTVSLGRRVLLRPELTAVVGVVLVFAFFVSAAYDTGFLSLTATRNYLEVAASVGIIATAVTLLLIAGEFDLSVGTMVGTAGILFAYPVVYMNWPIAVAVPLAFGGACLVGLVNGLLTTKTRVPSFIVTLAMMFVLGGTTAAVTNSLTGTVSITGIRSSLDGDPLLFLFGGEIFGISIAIFWWIGLVLVAAWLLDFTRVGNWIYATGGDVEAAKKAGVPVHRVKIALFVATAAAATLVGILSALIGDAADVTTGSGKEFQAAAAAVIGGTLIWGGYGSAIGTAAGALLFGIVNQGFFFTSIDDAWFLPFVGVMLLLAVIVNTYTRQLALRQSRRRDR